jgi:copper resistance protein C
MRSSLHALRALVPVAALLASSIAFAHPKLVSSTPADKAEVGSAAKIELNFSERLVSEFCAANLLMTAMPGMAAHSPMKMAFNVTGGSDEKTMVITPTKALPPGTYRVEWRAVSSDTHPMTGNITFDVK